jgi:hypothetical protein|tara:strand:+ start:64 stop:234 length:171 start_codon:yes stop_codon:yes gene_type:complete
MYIKYPTGFCSLLRAPALLKIAVITVCLNGYNVFTFQAGLGFDFISFLIKFKNGIN